MTMGKDNKTVLNVYSALVASLLMQITPSGTLQTVGAFLFLGALIGCYILRRKEDKGSLIENHMTYVIRTIWIWSFFLMIAMLASTLWIIGSEGHLVFANSIDNLMAGGSVPSEADMTALFKKFIYHNVMALLVCFGPCIIYIAYRITKGLARALKGYRVDNEKSWF